MEGVSRWTQAGQGYEDAFRRLPASGPEPTLVVSRARPVATCSPASCGRKCSGWAPEMLLPSHLSSGKERKEREGKRDGESIQAGIRSMLRGYKLYLKSIISHLEACGDWCWY